MAAHVLRLRAALLVGAFREPGRTIPRAIGFLALVIGTAVTASRALALPSLPDGVAATALVLSAAGLVLSFAIAPALTATVDPLDPRRFRTLGAAPDPLAAVLLLASLVSVPTWLLLVYEVVATIVWTQLGASAGSAIAGAVLHLLGCVLVARVVMALRAALGGQGRPADAAGVFVVALVVASVPATIASAAVWSPGAARALGRVAGLIAALVPGTALPAGEASGSGSVGLAVAIGIVVVAALAVAWVALVRRLLTTIEHPVVARGGAGLGWFALLPRTATGAIAARSLVYGVRDSRYLANLLVIPVAGILPVIPLLVAGVPIEVAALVPVPLMALFYGWLPHNDLAYDASAVWLHIASGVRGVADRAGRLAPVVLISVPVLAVATALSILVSGRGDAVLPVVGVTAALLLSGFGLSSIASVVAPYAVARPGDGPFQQPQRTDSTGAWSQALVLLGALAASAPTVWLAWLAIADRQVESVAVLWTGLGSGAAVLLIGIGIGAAVFDVRGTRIMEFAGAT
ncbi:hypothetical protein [Microbacterium sp. JZ101]